MACFWASGKLFVCRTKREINDAKEVTLANGRHALQGTCAVCGTKLLRFVASPAKAAVKR